MRSGFDGAAVVWVAGRGAEAVFVWVIGFGQGPSEVVDFRKESTVPKPPRSVGWVNQVGRLDEGAEGPSVGKDNVAGAGARRSFFAGDARHWRQCIVWRRPSMGMPAGIRAFSRNVQQQLAPPTAAPGDLEPFDHVGAGLGAEPQRQLPIL